MRQQYRSAECPAKLVLLVRGNWPHGIKIVPRVQQVIAKKFPSRAVKLVRSGLDDRVDDRSIAAPKLGAIRVRLDLEFLDGFDTGPQQDGKRQTVIVIDAVVQKVVRSFAVSVGENLGTRPAIVGPPASNPDPVRPDSDR